MLCGRDDGRRRDCFEGDEDIEGDIEGFGRDMADDSLHGHDRREVDG